MEYSLLSKTYNFLSNYNMCIWYCRCLYIFHNENDTYQPEESALASSGFIARCVSLDVKKNERPTAHPYLFGFLLHGFNSFPFSLSRARAPRFCCSIAPPPFPVPSSATLSLSQRCAANMTPSRCPISHLHVPNFSADNCRDAAGAAVRRRFCKARVL
jgi:hypothetical protein